MTTESIGSHLDHPLYKEALYQFQQGSWEIGLANLDHLIEKYPFVHELRSFRNEMKLRARIDHDEAREISRARKEGFRSLGIRLLGLGIIAVLVLAAYRGTSIWAQRQWSKTSQALDQEIAEIELAVKFRNGQDLLQVDRVEEALVLFNEVKAQDPDYSDLEAYIQSAHDLMQLGHQYTEGLRLVNAGDLTGGLLLLEEVAGKNPYFKDVTLKIDQLKKEFLLDELLQQAELAFHEGSWEEAVYGYENIRSIDPRFGAEIVEENLYLSYMNAAEIILDEEDSLEALQKAEGYFREALTLRPQSEEIILRRSEARQSIEERLVASYLDRAQSMLSNQEGSLEALGMAEIYFREALVYQPDNPEINLQLKLAQYFIDAQSDFNRALWDQVISNLEVVYSGDPNYARGTARQTLYDAYIARGKSSMASGAYESALHDFQRAAGLAEQQPEALLRLFEARVKIAEVQGILGNYENATQLYQDTIELSGLRVRADQDDPALAAALVEADSVAQAGNFAQAYRLYRYAMQNATGAYDTVTHVVKSGEYLTLIAAIYGSTVQAIATANDIADPNKIYTNQELIVPIIPRG